MPRIPGETLLTGFRPHPEKICLAKEACILLQGKYSQKLYPVCPILQEVVGKEKPSITKVPKTNLPLLDSIIKILAIFNGLIKLRPNLATVVWCVHSENLLKEWIDLIRQDLSALPQGLENDFPDTSRSCKGLFAELDLAELRYTMHSNWLVYFLPDDIEYGNWATFIEWRERQIRQAEDNGSSEAIEMNGLTCHYPAEAIKVINKISRELCPLVKILSEQDEQSNRDKIEQSQMLAGFLQKPAETEQNNKPIEPLTARNVFKKDGDFWTIRFQGGQLPPIKDSVGMHHIAHLLANPKKEVPATELKRVVYKPPPIEKKDVTNEAQQGGGVEDPPKKKGEDSRNIIDIEGMRNCRRELDKLRGELEKAKADIDFAAEERIEKEIATITDYLKSSTNFAGESRKFSEEEEKARVAVAKAIKRAIAAMEKESKPLWQHLTNSIRTGATCSYQPDRRIVWDL